MAPFLLSFTLAPWQQFLFGSCVQSPFFEVARLQNMDCSVQGVSRLSLEAQPAWGLLVWRQEREKRFENLSVYRVLMHSRRVTWQLCDW